MANLASTQQAQRMLQRDLLKRMKYAPFAIREAIVKENYDAARREFSIAINTGQNWAVIAWLTLAGTMGGGPAMLNMLYASLGVRDEMELIALVMEGRKHIELTSANDVPLETLWAESIEMLKTIHARDASFAPRTSSALALVPEAEVVEDEPQRNGSAFNGNGKHGEL